MSTSFGVKIKGEMVAVAFRSNWNIVWVNKLACLLPDKTKVHAIDNSPQGIKTIKDIKTAIKNCE